MVSRTESQDATQACLDAIAAHDDTVFDVDVTG